MQEWECLANVSTIVSNIKINTSTEQFSIHSNFYFIFCISYVRLASDWEWDREREFVEFMQIMLFYAIQREALIFWLIFEFFEWKSSKDIAVFQEKIHENRRIHIGSSGFSTFSKQNILITVKGTRIQQFTCNNNEKLSLESNERESTEVVRASRPSPSPTHNRLPLRLHPHLVRRLPMCLEN